MAKASRPQERQTAAGVCADKYLDQEHLAQYRIDFAQLPFEIYELTR